MESPAELILDEPQADRERLARRRRVGRARHELQDGAPAARLKYSRPGSQAVLGVGAE